MNLPEAPFSNNSWRRAGDERGKGVRIFSYFAATIIAYAKETKKRTGA
jgi:hypothetical protein